MDKLHGEILRFINKETYRDLLMPIKAYIRMVKMRVYLFACIEKNIGDDLFVKLLCERYPDVDFIIKSSAEYGTLSQIPNLHFSKLFEYWQRFTNATPRNPVKKLAANILRVLCTLVLPRGDVGVYIVGNVFRNLNYKGWEDSRWFRDRIALVKQFYLISTNFGPYNDVRWKEDFERIYPRMADVCFRDKASYELFENLPNTRYAPDAVISLGMQSGNTVENKRVIISPIDCALRQRSEKLNNAASSYESKIAAAAKRFLSEGYTVTFLNSQAEQDRPACNRIMEQLDSPNVEVVDYDGNLEAVFELYQNSCCAVATRLHTIILAWLHNIPVVPIVYDIKVANLLKTCGFSGKQYDIYTMDEVSADDILNAVQQYDFALSEDILNASQLQFREIDKALSLNGV